MSGTGGTGSTCLDADLVDAYRRTHYRVQAEPPFELHIGQPSADLAAWHAQAGVACSAFITAWNPFGQPLDAAANTARQQQLRQQLQALGLPAVDGLGQGADGDWPPEPSLLVAGLGLAEARAMGMQWQQNALVWAGADALPQLILLR